jgi:hypothetical protein
MALFGHALHLGTRGVMTTDQQLSERLKTLPPFTDLSDRELKDMLAHSRAV